ncbi:ATP-binding protein [Teredinibacter sp. KSP-S5-2]|uniref:ATP-binding protein n=1 Tax=Teredinibacter sp. KSP-S5-2 TaxID=3034506 RepID=UPI0029345878|nr:ATP-binding protein [Teredinibacter sp. KSP-S5-2]WNO08747.1 ATP-binding protein [Teredinibacter sp. KSP-S5-2]
MNRPFTYLYILIVASVIFLGLLINMLWRWYIPDPVDTFEFPFFSAVEQIYKTETDNELAKGNITALIAQLNADYASGKIAHSFELVAVDDFANSKIYKSLAGGEPVYLEMDDGSVTSYKRIAQSLYVLAVKTDFPETRNPVAYRLSIVFFYVAIALVVYFWVWPLSRDLQRLQLQAHNIGKDGAPKKIDIGKRSAVYPLARAFNKMSKRIKELVSSYKDMTYAVSHELRTPLARMKFALEMLQESKKDDQEQFVSQVGDIKKDVADMDNLINQLLNYAGFEKESGDLDMQEGDLVEMVAAHIDLFESQCPEIQFSFNAEVSPCNVFCEWNLMERAVHNLLQNATRYARKNIVVHIHIEKTCPKQQVCIQVEDDGVGIPETERKRVFSAFVRLRNGTNVEKSGFGLGLSIVQRVMQWHEGRASVDVSAMGGARFTLRWPVK